MKTKPVKAWGIKVDGAKLHPEAWDSKREATKCLNGMPRCVVVPVLICEAEKKRKVKNG